METVFNCLPTKNAFFFFCFTNSQPKLNFTHLPVLTHDIISQSGHLSFCKKAKKIPNTLSQCQASFMSDMFNVEKANCLCDACLFVWTHQAWRVTRFNPLIATSCAIFNVVEQRTVQTSSFGLTYSFTVIRCYKIFSCCREQTVCKGFLTSIVCSTLSLTLTVPSHNHSLNATWPLTSNHGAGLASRPTVGFTNK